MPQLPRDRDHDMREVLADAAPLLERTSIGEWTSVTPDSYSKES